MTKRILKGTKRKKTRKLGFLTRMNNNSGYKILKARRRKSRKTLSIRSNSK